MESIQKAFKFTSADLKANQANQLTAKQNEMIKKSSRNAGCFAILALIFTIGSVAFIVFLSSSLSDTESSASPEALPIIGAVFGGVILIVVLFIFIGRFRARDLRSGAISVAEGMAKMESKTFRSNDGVSYTTYFMTVGNTKFQLPTQSQYESIPDSANLRVYFVKHPPVHIILSMEIL